MDPRGAVYHDGNDGSEWRHRGNDDATTTTYKHALELTQSEQDIIALAEQTCKDVVVLYAGEHVFEMADMQDDDNIGGILWIGRPGDGGMDAVGEVLAGTVNPSGKTVDEWTRDLTNDPTYANTSASTYSDSDGASTGYSGMDYEEDIYLGYKFYETYWYDATNSSSSDKPSPKIYDGDTTGEKDGYTATDADGWYEYNMVYPFGYGLSYTDFSYELVSLKTDTGEEVNSTSGLNSTAIYTSTNQQGAKSLIATVDVTNTGTVAGKDVVEAYVQAPYGVVAEGASEEGLTGIEKPAWTLAGYAKTDTIKPGKTKTVTIEMDLQDIASFDYDDKNGDGVNGYTLDKGDYTVHVMQSSSHLNMEKDQNGDYENAAYDCETFELDATTVLDLDTYSGNEVETWFSGSQDTTDNSDAWKDDYDSMLPGTESGSMTLLSRANFDETMPKAPTSAQLSAESKTMAAIEKYYQWDADASGDEGEPWEKTVADLDGWTQGAGVTDEHGLYEITLDDMAGVDINDSKWVTFMNQLTWEEISRGFAGEPPACASFCGIMFETVRREARRAARENSAPDRSCIIRHIS